MLGHNIHRLPLVHYLQHPGRLGIYKRITVNSVILMKLHILCEAFVKPILKASVCIYSTTTKI
jgi:hypothetical protein